MDSIDAKILSLLQRDCRLGLETLAAATGLSVASVQRRLKSLRAQKVIEAEVAVLDPAKVGQSMGFVVMVELERERLDQIDAFVRRAQAEPKVQQCYYVTGEADFCLICTAADMEDFEDLTKRLFFEDSNVRRFRTSVVMARRKVGLEVPVGSG
ncbi:Lrp/AsnC family transcriptional regulator [Ruegeria marina]|uniref:DNA-binding transcriptional regulator, Lrp family n=1 Tax=Ruegeria marina TaxID=639004 RepID=A0A1G6LGQ5_9RHOB|nr:Lrp/AsnC family transcriptional regulator [Ruegeria marina]SDC42137.1 DNA-binding transcriptional regulator, Lrp family [Ruegeria marina]